MADDRIDIQFGAQTGDLKAGTQQAADAVKQTTSQMEQAVEHMNSHVRDQMKAVSDSMTQAVKSLTSLGTLLGELIAGVLSAEALKGAVESARSYNESILTLSRTMGMTTEEASILATGLHMIGANTEGYITANMKLAMHVKNSEDALNQLGMATRGSNGALLTQTELFNNALTAMGEYKQGADRNQFALYAFGRGAAEVMQYLKLNKTVMEEATAVAKQYGLVIGQEAALQTETFGIKLNTLGVIMDAIKIKIGNDLLPELMTLAGYFSEIGPAAIAVIEWSLKAMIQILEGLVLVVRDVWNIFDIAFTGIGKGLAMVAAALVAAAQGKFIEAWDIMKIGVKDVADTTKAQLDNIVLYHEAAEQRVAALWAGAKTKGPATVDPVPKGTKTFTAPSTTGPFDQWKKDLQKMQDDEQSFLGLSKQRQLEFWQDKTAKTKAGSADELAVYHEIAVLKKGIAKEEFEEGLADLQLEMAAERRSGEEKISLAKTEAARIGAVYGENSVKYQAALAKIAQLQKAHDDEMRRLEEQQLDAAKKHTDALIALKDHELQTKLALHQISDEDEKAALRRLEEEKYNTELEFLDKKLALMAGLPREQEKVNAQIQALMDKHRLALQQIDAKEQLDRQKNIEGWLNVVTQAVDRSVLGMIQGTLTLQAALRNIFQSILAEFINKLVKKMVDEWLIGEIMKFHWSLLYSNLLIALGIKEAAAATATEATKTAATVAGETARATVEEGGAVSSLALQAVTAIKAIFNDAATVFAGVFAYFAPMMGPWAAIPAGAASAVVAGTAGSIVSAAGGWDVPRDSLAMIHKNEMILPAGLAENVRSMSGGGGGGDLHITIHATDAKSFADQLARADSALSKTIKRSIRDSKLRL
jgi:hypothetical protein